MQNSRYQLAISLIALFTLLQLVVLLIFGYTPYPDSNGYIYLAEECIKHGEAYPVSSLLNEYPFLWNIGTINSVVASLALFHSIKPLLIIYSLMKGLSAWLFYAITNKMCGYRIAIIALIMYMIYPANYGEGTSLLSELPFMFFIFLGLYCSIVRNWLIVGGMMLAIANWYRPMAIVFLLALILFFIYKWRNSLKIIFGYIIIITIIGMLSMQRTGLFLYQAKTGWMALIDYSTNNTEESNMVRENHEWSVSQKDSVWQTMFFDWLKGHPVDYISQMPKKIINTYVSDNVNMCTFIPGKKEKEYMYEEVSMPVLKREFPIYSAVQWLTIINLIIYLALLIGSFLNILYFKKKVLILPLSIILLGTLVLLFVGHGEARFHQPFMPFFIILTAQLINQRYGKSQMD